MAANKKPEVCKTRWRGLLFFAKLKHYMLINFGGIKIWLKEN
jgi:hypothetical protein